MRRLALGLLIAGGGLAILVAAAIPLGGPWWVVAAAGLVVGAAAWRVAVLAPRRRSAAPDGAPGPPDELDEVRRRLSIGPLAQGPTRVGPDGRGESRAALLADLIAARQAAADDGVVRLRGVLSAVDDAILATDAAGTVFLCNPAAERLIGVRAEKVLGRHLHETLTQSDLLDLHAEAGRGRAARRQVRFNRDQGARIAEASAAPLPGHGGELGGVAITLRDVTELAQAMDVKTDFVANASHELRTPITALRMALDTLTGHADLPAATRERLMSIISSNTARLEEMVRDLLDLSRLESPDVRVNIGPVRAADLPAVLAPNFEPICEQRRLRLEFDFAPELESLRTDAGLLVLILKNLIDNATKFAYEGTTIRVVGRAAALGEPADAAAGGSPAGRGACFDVIDEGIGIPLSHQQRIFERYYQVDAARTATSPRRGTGLGLAIVKHAVRALGGSVRVSSVWKRGTTMTVELPAALADR